MPPKEDIEPASPPGLLQGVARALATIVTAHVDLAVAAPVDARETDQAMRTVALIARAALSLQQLQAAEDKADDRAVERTVKRAAAPIRARHFTLEEDETDMNERDPRLDDPQLMAEADAELERRLAELGVQFESKGLAGRPTPGHPREDAGLLVRPQPHGAETASATARDDARAAAGQQLLAGDDPNPWRVLAVERANPQPGLMTLRLDRTA